MKLLNNYKLPNPVTMYYSLLIYILVFPRNNNHELCYDIRKEGKLTESNYEQGIRPYVPA